mmetsp:Transcript_9093/g.11825  ORF Transcript_9093/g.11825 Transcript_9093/m.11825 type:complete len:384 (+) Transcript_9093:152-1303(+)
MGRTSVVVLFVAVAAACFGGDLFWPHVSKLHSTLTGTDQVVGLNPAFLTTEEKKRAAFDGPELRRKLGGQVCLVTGANAGLGLETSRWLYKSGCQVIASGRRMKALIKACDEITRTKSKGSCVPMELDLAKFSSIKAFAESFKQRFHRLDVFVQNAGITFWKDRAITEDGIESMFQVNHLGHFYLTQLLDDVISQPNKHSTKIVMVSSAAHYGPVPAAGIYFDLDELNDENNFDGYSFYGQSKLANVLFAQELSERINSQQGRIAFVNACGPGMTKTNVTEEFRIKIRNYVKDQPALKPLAEAFISVFDFIERQVTWTTADGARTQLYLSMAHDVEIKNLTGKYYHPQAIEVQPSKFAQGELGKAMQAKLWEFSESILRSKGL